MYHGSFDITPVTILMRQQVFQKGIQYSSEDKSRRIFLCVWRLFQWFW